MSPGSEDEAAEMEMGAPRPAVREMGKAGFSIGAGWERGSGRSGMWLLGLHWEMLAQLCPGSILMCPFPGYLGCLEAVCWSRYLHHIYLAFQS